MADGSTVLFGRPGGRLCVGRADPTTIMQIGFWPDTATAVHQRIKQLAGIQTTLEPGRFARVGNGLVLRSAFDTYLLVDCDTDAFRPGTGEITVTDLSDARRGVTIDGPASEPFLNRDIAVDLSVAACPVGSGLQTVMHHVPVLLWRIDDTGFLLHAYRSYMDDLIEWMRDMALPFEG